MFPETANREERGYFRCQFSPDGKNLVYFIANSIFEGIAIQSVKERDTIDYLEIDNSRAQIFNFLSPTQLGVDRINGFELIDLEKQTAVLKPNLDVGNNTEVKKQYGAVGFIDTRPFCPDGIFISSRKGLAQLTADNKVHSICKWKVIYDKLQPLGYGFQGGERVARSGDKPVFKNSSNLQGHES